MNPIKLVDRSGGILGAILIPEEAARRLHIQGHLHITPPTEVRFSSFPTDDLQVRDVVIAPSHVREDAVMLINGTLWDFEKCKDCFFIPGYAFSQREK